MRRETYEVSRRSALPFYLRVPIRLERIQMELNKVKNLVEEAEMSLGIIICVEYMGQCIKKKKRNMQRVPGHQHAGSLPILG